MEEPKVVAFDLDDVLCVRDSEEGKVDKYRTCRPVPEMIKIVNDCYNRGHTIIIYTARGFKGFHGDIHETYANLYPLTLQQLKDWGVKFHQLVLGKIYYDILIDDKAINSLSIKSADGIEAWL